MARVVSVMPAQNGWQVSTDGDAPPLTLANGRAAEEKAIEIARTFVDSGEPATVQVRLADGSLAARFVTPSPNETGWRWRTPHRAAG